MGARWDIPRAAHQHRGWTLAHTVTSKVAQSQTARPGTWRRNISVLTQSIPLPGLPRCHLGVSILLMPSNRDRLRRTPDGRYEVGVYIEKDKYARYVAQVLVPSTCVSPVPS